LLITSECDTVKFDFLFFLLCFNLVFSISDCFLGFFAPFRQPVIIRIHNYAIFLNRVWYSDSWNIYLNYSVFMINWYLYINIFIWHLLLRYSIHGLINWSNVFWTIHTFRYLFYWKYTNPRLSFKKKAVRKLLNFVKGNTHIAQKRFYSEMNTVVNGWFWSLSGNKICRWMKPNTQIYIKVDKRIWLWRVIHCICS
jgi:hypothetical protein